MNNALAILFAGSNENKFNNLTKLRTTCSLPFCGRYRLIDFTLSNLVNAGITNIGIVARHSYNSLMDHIRQGRDWDLNRKYGGITVFPPHVLNAYAGSDSENNRVDQLHSILTFVKESREEYVILGGTNVIMNIDFDEVFEKHMETGADITILTYRAPTPAGRRVIATVNDDKRVIDLILSETPSPVLREVGLNFYILRKSLFIDLIEDAHARGLTDLERDILIKNIGILKVFAHRIESYAAIIDDVRSYYAENMKAALNVDVRQDLFYCCGTIYTKVKDSAPTVYREGASVSNSLIADGCVIEGVVENSVLFRGVHVKPGAVVKNSIIMEHGTVGANSHVTCCITDKGVTINDGRTIAGFETFPYIIEKNAVV